MDSSNLRITGNDLTVADISSFVANPRAGVSITENTFKNAKRAYSFVHEHAKEDVIYGVNTGFGPMAGHLIGSEQLIDLQYNLIRSHAVGMGDPLPERFVLAAMLIRLNTLAKGYSGVSVELLNHLAIFINQ
jgi:histidine ammonia-lyase